MSDNITMKGMNIWPLDQTHNMEDINESQQNNEATQ